LLSKIEKKIFSFIKNLPRKFYFLFWVGIFFYVLKYIVGFLIPLQQKQFLDEALKLKSIYINNFYFLVLLFIASVVLLLIQYYCFRKLRVSLGKYLYKLCINKIVKIPKQKIVSKGTGYYSSVIVNLTQSLSTLISPTIFDFFFGAVQMIVVNILIYQWNKAVFVVLCIAYIVAAINTYFFHKLRKKYMDLFQETSAIISSETNDIIANAFTVRTFNALYFFTRPLWKKIDTNRVYLDKFLKTLEINRFVFALIKTSSFVIMLVLVLDSIFKGEMTYGQLLALVSYFESLFSPFHSYITFLGDMVNYGSWLDRFEAAFEDVLDSNEESVFLEEKIKNISLNNVVMPYGEDKTPMTINFDKETAIVGLSGEGKTSVLKILYRELIPESGEIMLNQEKRIYNRIPLLHYYGRINILNQDVEIFNKNLEFNLTLGKKVVNQEEIHEIIKNIDRDVEMFLNFKIARMEEMPQTIIPLLTTYEVINVDEKLKKNCLNRFIKSKLKNKRDFVQEIFNCNYIKKEEYKKIIDDLGLEKLVGRKLGEKGTFVSGGEKQRIAFGRFLLKKNFDFFILDEPFSSLDAFNEKKLMLMILDVTKGCPGIIISHKIHILEQLANDFVIIKNGRISKTGTLESLMKDDEFFQNLRKKYYDNFSHQRLTTSS
jgi:ABC-type multidrug transport system fused ATPase/permease subunit